MLKQLQEQLTSTIPNKHEQIRMLVIGSILTANYTNGVTPDAKQVVSDADKLATDILAELKKL